MDSSSSLFEILGTGFPLWTLSMILFGYVLGTIGAKLGERLLIRRKLGDERSRESLVNVPGTTSPQDCRELEITSGRNQSTFRYSAF